MKNGFDTATMGSIFYLIKKEKIEAKKKKNKELEKLKQYYAKITNSVTKTRENSSTTFRKLSEKKTFLTLRIRHLQLETKIQRIRTSDT